jgi:hypothetical protein
MRKSTVMVALLTLFFGALGFAVNKSGSDKIILPPVQSWRQLQSGI